MGKRGTSPVLIGVAGLTAASLLATFGYLAFTQPPKPLPAPPPPPPPPPTAAELADAADAHPNDPAAWARLCAVTAQSYWRDSSLDDCDKAVALQPEALQTRLDRAFLLFKVGKSDQASKDLETVLAREPGNPAALFGRSLIHVQFKRMGKAAEDRKRALALDEEVVFKLERAYGFRVPWEYRR